MHLRISLASLCLGSIDTETSSGVLASVSRVQGFRLSEESASGANSVNSGFRCRPSMAKEYWLKSVRRRHTNAVPKFQREQQLIESSKIGCAGHRLDAGKVSSALK